VVVEDSLGAAPEGAVPLSAAIEALRADLMHAVWAGQFAYELNGQQRQLRFKPAAVELTLQVAVTLTGSVKAGVKWWLIDAGGALARDKAVTQTVKLSLQPALFDEDGGEVELLIDASADADPSAGGDGDEGLLDAPD
jgi:hypothetical protein